MATLGLLHFSFGIKSRKRLKGRAREKAGGSQCAPVGAVWAREARRKEQGPVKGLLGDKSVILRIQTSKKTKQNKIQKPVLLMDM